jgi:sRNA-binding carbon storage regulator CsrA
MEKAITMDSHVIEILPIDKQSVEIPFLKPASMKLFRMNLAQKQ